MEAAYGRHTVRTVEKKIKRLYQQRYLLSDVLFWQTHGAQKQKTDSLNDSDWEKEFCQCRCESLLVPVEPGGNVERTPNSNDLTLWHHRKSFSHTR
jgi:hypothetical protein